MSGVVIYARVSTAEQAREGISLEVQRARCRDYARALGLEVAGEYTDAGASGGSLERPGVREALEHAQRDRRALLVYALDRLTRSVRDLGAVLELVRAGRLELVSVTDALNTGTAAGRLAINITGSVAEWQRDAGNERVRDALAHARAQGARLGALPLGLKRGSERDRSGRLVVEPDPNGAALRARVLELAAPYALELEGEPVRWLRGAYARTARALNELGITTARGARWRAESVRRVLEAAP